MRRAGRGVSSSSGATNDRTTRAARKIPGRERKFKAPQNCTVVRRLAGRLEPRRSADVKRVNKEKEQAHRAKKREQRARGDAELPDTRHGCSCWVAS